MGSAGRILFNRMKKIAIVILAHLTLELVARHDHNDDGLNRNDDRLNRNDDRLDRKSDRKFRSEDRTKLQSDESEAASLSEESLDWEEDNNQAQIQASSENEAQMQASSAEKPISAQWCIGGETRAGE